MMTYEIKELNTTVSVNYLPVSKRIFWFHFTSLLLFASQSVSECRCCHQGMRGAVVGGGGRGTKHWTLEPVPSFHLIQTSGHSESRVTTKQRGDKMKGFERSGSGLTARCPK